MKVTFTIKQALFILAYVRNSPYEIIFKYVADVTNAVADNNTTVTVGITPALMQTIWAGCTQNSGTAFNMGNDIINVLTTAIDKSREDYPELAKILDGYNENAEHIINSYVENAKDFIKNIS